MALVALCFILSVNEKEVNKTRVDPLLNKSLLWSFKIHFKLILHTISVIYSFNLTIKISLHITISVPVCYLHDLVTFYIILYFPLNNVVSVFSSSMLAQLL
jgi:hypothetical protein